MTDNNRDTKIVSTVKKTILVGGDHLPLPISDEDRDWLIKQLEDWPNRVDPQKTANITFLMKSAAVLIRDLADIPKQESCLKCGRTVYAKDASVSSRGFLTKCGNRLVDLNQCRPEGCPPGTYKEE